MTQEEQTHVDNLIQQGHRYMHMLINRKNFTDLEVQNQCLAWLRAVAQVENR